MSFALYLHSITKGSLFHHHKRTETYRLYQKKEKSTTEHYTYLDVHYTYFHVLHTFKAERKFRAGIFNVGRSEAIENVPSYLGKF